MAGNKRLPAAHHRVCARPTRHCRAHSVGDCRPAHCHLRGEGQRWRRTYTIDCTV